MFKVGDKAKGFKFDDGTDDVVYVRFMDELEGIVGKVTSVHENSFVILFQEEGAWEYPASLWHLAKVEEEVPLKIGEEVPFKKGDRVVVVAAQPPEGEYKNGDKGTVVNLSYQDQWVDVKIDGSESLYSTMYFSEVQKDTSFNTKDEITPSFQAGDRVKFTESSLASGMIDAKEDDVFTVKESYKRAVTLKELQGHYHVTHFEHVQEKAMNNTEEQEIKWEVGQEVWDCAYGKGVVESVSLVDDEIHVLFERFNTSFNYDVNGILYGGVSRSLFFSEPKIEAEKFPPKKPFTPKLKKGDLVVVETAKSTSVQEVVKETEDMLYTLLTDYNKKEINFVFKLGEEVEFK